MLTTPDALTLAVRAIVRDEVARALAERCADAHGYSQLALPPWARSTKTYLRLWRELHAEGHPGATRAGRLRLMTADASAEVARRLDERARRRPAPPESGTSILARLGGERRGSR